MGNTPPPPTPPHPPPPSRVTEEKKKGRNPLSKQKRRFKEGGKFRASANQGDWQQRWKGGWEGEFCVGERPGRGAMQVNYWGWGGTLLKLKEK